MIKVESRITDGDDDDSHDDDSPCTTGRLASGTVGDVVTTQINGGDDVNRCVGAVWAAVEGGDKV